MVLAELQQVHFFINYEIFDNDNANSILSSIAFESLLAPYEVLKIIFKFCLLTLTSGKILEPDMSLILQDQY